MIFTSIEFVLFFLVVMTGRFLFLNFKHEKFFLLVASYVFYMSWNVACGGLIFFTSMIDYWVGRALPGIEEPRRRKSLLIASLVVNLGLLAFFKYTNFALWNGQQVLSWFGVQMSPFTVDIILPAGISFFTFQSMSYTIDVYRRELEPCRNVSDFLLFVSFFPQLIAGPIVRAADFLPQLLKRMRPTALDFEIGLSYFLLGATKKMVLSDQIAGHVDLIFANPAAYDGATLLSGALGYAVQIYCDFSGYSDMAIGSARMMGFRFCENFQMPYSALSVTEFWRRWHISLSTWLRDYVYVPLGGNRKGRWNTYRNLLITMLLGGLWHGASWNFVLWGAIHGLALAVHKLWKEQGMTAWIEERFWLRSVWKPVALMLTLGVVLVGWVFFRAQTFGEATLFLSRMFSWTSEGTRLGSPFILPVVTVVALVHLVVPKDVNWAEFIPHKSISIRTVAYAALLLLIVCLGATNASPFIYFQF